MARYSGRLLMGTALIHNAIGVATYARPLADIARAGGFNAVEPHWDRATAFWFLVSGGLIFTTLGTPPVHSAGGVRRT
mgnify:CR=1 FL=1